MHIAQSGFCPLVEVDARQPDLADCDPCAIEGLERNGEPSDQSAVSEELEKGWTGLAAY